MTTPRASTERPPDDAPRWLRGALWTLLALAALYTLVRALRLKLDYYDAFAYLYDASLLAGDALGGVIDERRPWLLSVLLTPIVAVCRRLGPANPWLLRGPHLLAFALSLGAVAALLALLKRHFGATLALLGAVLFVAGRCFIHYGANTMCDLGLAGLCALTLLLHLHAVRARKLGWFALAGLTFGLAIGMKITAPMFAATILVTEAASLVERVPSLEGRPARLRLRLDLPRRVGLLVEALATVATFAAIESGVFLRLYGARAWTSFKAVMVATFALRDLRMPGETWHDSLPMLVTIVSAPALLLAATGVMAVVSRPRRDDVPFAAWLVGYGAGLLFAVSHNEARYLLPIVPPVIYFALRGVEAAVALGRRAGRRGVVAAAVIVGLLVAGTLANGLAQAREDADPIFTRDLHGGAARAMAARRAGGPAFTVGIWQTLTPATPGPMLDDEFWSIFHASSFILAYELGEPVTSLPGNGAPVKLRDALFWRLADGDRALRLDGTFFVTRSFPAGARAQALEVWSVRRHNFQAAATGAPDPVFGPAAPVSARRFVETVGGEPAPAAVDLRVEDGHASLTAVPPGGPWWIYTKTPKRTWAFAGTSSATPGPSNLVVKDGGDVDGLVLIRADVERIE